MHNDNFSMKAEVQNLQAQITDQVSCPLIFYFIPNALMLCEECVLLFDTPSPSLCHSPHADCVPAGVGPVSEEVRVKTGTYF